jgi:hypothetical protein
MEPLRIKRWIYHPENHFCRTLVSQDCRGLPPGRIRLVRVAEQNSQRVSDLKVASENVIVITCSLER